MKALKLVLFSTISLVLLSGCWDMKSLEEQAFVVVLGIDTTEDDMVEVTFQIANPQVGSTEGGMASNEPSSDIVTITAFDVLAAKELANNSVARKINFDQLRTIIIGEELAKKPLLHHIIASSIVDPEMRRETNLIVSKEKASQFIHANKPILETRPHKYFSFMQSRWLDTGYVPFSNLNRYFQRLSGELFLAIYASTERNELQRKNEDDYVAGQVPQKAGDPAQMMGSAVFKNGKMIGTLTGEETRIALLLRRKSLNHSAFQSFPDPVDDKYRITVRVMKKNNVKINVNTKKSPPEINVTVPVTIQVFSDTSLTNYTTDKENQQILKQSIKESLEKATKKFIQKTQDEFKGEPFKWNLEVRRAFWTMEEYDKYDWEKKYQYAHVDVKYEVKLENLGEQLKPAVINRQKKE